MKKILPLLVVSILVLSGLGAVATTSEKENTQLTTLPPDLSFNIRGGLGITIGCFNAGNHAFTGTINVSITVHGGNIILLSDSWKLVFDEIEIPSKTGGTLARLLMVGFGWTTIAIKIETPLTGPSQGQTDGFILGPFILIKQLVMP